MEVRLQSSHTDSPWTCQISLRHEFDHDTNEPIQPRESKFGGPLFDPSKVESALRRAQLSILNPSVALNKFVEFDLSCGV
jgi:hypothetical protein